MAYEIDVKDQISKIGKWERGEVDMADIAYAQLYANLAIAERLEAIAEIMAQATHYETEEEKQAFDREFNDTLDRAIQLMQNVIEAHKKPLMSDCMASLNRAVNDLEMFLGDISAARGGE